METRQPSASLSYVIETSSVVAWRAGYRYLRRGLPIVRAHWPLYLRLLIVYATPALVAAFLMVTVAAPTLWDTIAILTLPWVTAVLGTVVMMLIIGAHAQGRSVSLRLASWEALRWVPRYLWTNAHTTLIFWLPVGGLLEFRERQAELFPVAGTPGLILSLLWWLTVGGAALYLHTRTLLAPFLAVHSDLPGTLATLEAWRLSGRYFLVCLSTFVIASLPIVAPLAGLALLAVTAFGEVAVQSLQATSSALIWAAIQVVRLSLMPAVYLLYRDLWPAEIECRDRQGVPGLPWLARALLVLTRPLPQLHPRRAPEGERAGG